MVESLSKLAFFFGHANKSHHYPLKTSHSNGFDSRPPSTPHNPSHRLKENKPVMRSPSLGHKRWSSMHRKRLMKDKNRLTNLSAAEGLPSRIPIKTSAPAVHMVSHRNEGQPHQSAEPVKSEGKFPLTDPVSNAQVVLNASAKDALGDSSPQLKPSMQNRLEKSTPAAPSKCCNPFLVRLQHATNGMQAFVILLQRLTVDMDVFALASIKRQLVKYQEEWLIMKLKLVEASVEHRRLQQEIETQTFLHDRKLEELRSFHATQLDNLSERHKQELASRSREYEQKVREEGEKMRDRELALHKQFDATLRQIQQQTGQKALSVVDETTNTQIEILKLRNSACPNQNLISESCQKVEEAEKRFTEKLQDTEARYLNRRHRPHPETKKHEQTNTASISEEKFAAAAADDENHSSTKSTLEDDNRPVTQVATKPDHQILNWQQEISSLRVVLDLKNAEIHQLRRQNEKHEKHLQDLPHVIQKFHSAQARVEDLNAQLRTKHEREHTLMEDNRKLSESLQRECEKKKRLAFQNEELLWKLKKSVKVARTLASFNYKPQIAENRSAVVVRSTSLNSVKFIENEVNYNEKTAKKQVTRSHTDAELQESASAICDASPKVLGVVEKNDSVSWVLEMNESPSAVASRMFRRANSLRALSATKTRYTPDTQSQTLPWRKKKTSVESRRNCEQKTISTDIASLFTFLKDCHFDGEQMSTGDRNADFNLAGGGSNCGSFDLELGNEVAENDLDVKIISDATGSLESTKDSEWVDNFLAPPPRPLDSKLITGTRQ